MGKKNKKNHSAVNRILVIQLIVMLLLLLGVCFFVASKTRESALAQMSSLNDERALIINNYVAEAEKTLVSFSHAKQVTALLCDPENETLLEEAQNYVEEFSQDVPFLEGVYISQWDTKVLAHTNPLVRNMVTRTDPDALAELHDGMTKAGRGVFNTGIIKSPASGKQIFSMYKAVYDEKHHAVGLVGMGIFTDGLVYDLADLQVHGLENSGYSLLNAPTNRYIFNSDEYMVDREPVEKELLELTEKGRYYTDTHSGEAPTKGRFVYKDEFGAKRICNWYYLEEHNWFLLLTDRTSEVYQLSNSMLAFLLVFGLLLFGLMVVFHLINKRQEAVNKKLSSQIVKTEKTKESLTTAMFKDILTESSNRVSFSVNAPNMKSGKDQCHYFVFVNIAGFSQINASYGNDTGDQFLVATAETLKKVFPNGTVYRTGSDEFIVVLEADSSVEGYESVINSVNTAHAILLTPQETPVGSLTADYKIAVGKKTANIDTSVISALKEVTNRIEEAEFGQVQFIDLD